METELKKQRDNFEKIQRKKRRIGEWAKNKKRSIGEWAKNKKSKIGRGVSKEEREKLEDKQKEIKNNQENVERKHREDFLKEYEEMYMNMSLEYCLLKREEGEFLWENGGKFVLLNEDLNIEGNEKKKRGKSSKKFVDINFYPSKSFNTRKRNRNEKDGP